MLQSCYDVYLSNLGWRNTKTKNSNNVATIINNNIFHQVNKREDCKIKAIIKIIEKIIA